MKHVVTFRVSNEEKEFLEDFVRVRGTSISTLMRALIQNFSEAPVDSPEYGNWQ